MVADPVRITNCVLSQYLGAHLKESHKNVASGPPKEPNSAVAFSRLVTQSAETRQRENGNNSGCTAEATNPENHSHLTVLGMNNLYCYDSQEPLPPREREAKFTQNIHVRTAYEVLSDKDQRRVYDRQYEKVISNAGSQTSKASGNYTYEGKRERRYSYRKGSSESESAKNAEAKEAEHKRKVEEDNARRASESLHSLMKELERISGRFERKEY
ncbi:hypothetical protein BHYA_0203g00150 [Botrytis hyacinthi]|uniref:J domain-containing protein n=1 Tax=Botrytis hyacinthi TaxID=278943 RepID=A0A4Z1GFY4_9HELO|nr:hypothetical protein BHYA_0203g00150 [Botrytis hyacinthi]